MSLSRGRDGHGRSKTLAMFIVLVGLAFGQAVTSEPPSFRQLLAKRLRAGYLSAGDFAVLPGMATAGMNAALVKFGALEAPMRPADAAVMRRWSADAAGYDIALFPVFNWWGAHEPGWLKGFNPWVSANGTVLRDTPCPYTPEFWDRAITSRALAILATLGNGPVGAVVIDMEMYGGKKAFYVGECYCDRCFARYLRKLGKGSKLPPVGDRARMVAETGQDECVPNSAARPSPRACRLLSSCCATGSTWGASGCPSPRPCRAA